MALAVPVQRHATAIIQALAPLVVGMDAAVGSHAAEFRAAGYLHLDKARVRWFLSINYNTIPEEVKEKGLRTFRSITVDGDEF